LAVRWRRAELLTPTEFLETRFSSGVRQLFVWSTLPLKILDDALKIAAIGIFVAAALKVSPDGTAVAIGLVTLLYTVLGGLWAVVITDFVQFVLVSTGILLLAPLALHAAGGWHHVAAVLPREFFLPVRKPYTWGYVASFLLLTTLSYAGNWSLIQRFYSARSDRAARGIGWTAAVLFLVLPPIWIVTGMIARAFISPQGFDPQTIYAKVSLALLPPGMFGLIIAALIAAAMSVISSSYNVTAAVLTIDVHQRLIRPAASQRELIVVGRVLTALVGLVALAIAVLILHFHWNMFDTMVLAFGFFLPPTVLPVIAGLLSKRLSAKGAVAGFLTGVGFGISFLLYREIAHPPNANTAQAASIVLSSAMSALALGLSIAFFPAKGEAAERSNRFIEKLGRSVPAAENLESPVAIAGLVIGVMGFTLVILGLGVVFSVPNRLTLGVGFALLVVSIAMRLGSRRPKLPQP
jgi:Na+/proline symporter